VRPSGNDIGGNETPAVRSRLVFSLSASHRLANNLARAEKPVDTELTWPPQTVNRYRFGEMSNAWPPVPGFARRIDSVAIR